MSRLRALLAFPIATLLQQFRDRTSLFFMLALPVIVMVIVGSTFAGAAEVELGVVGGDAALRDRLYEEVQTIDAVELVAFDDVEAARRAVRRSDVEGVLVLGGDSVLGDDSVLGGDSPQFITDESSTSAIGVRTVAQRLIDQATSPVGDGPGVSTRVIGENSFAGRSPFSLTAAQNLVLFTFITALTAGVIVVRVRKNGVLNRSISTAAGFGSVAIGLMGAWFLLALVQSIIIGIVGVFFGVKWGSVPVVLALLVAFALVGAGAGLLTGTLFATEDLVGSVGPPIALVLAALGGCMVPSEVFPPAIARISQFTPHYWALRGWRASIFDGAQLADITTELGVLFAFAAGLIALSSLLLRRELAG